MSAEATAMGAAEVAPEQQAEPRGSAFARARSWIDDRINPILVKEVRQALRGRYFRNLFWFTVVAATFVSVLTLLNFGGNPGAGSLGPRFFSVNLAVMIAAICVFVPFSAFQAMGGEWEENTYDLLVISNLRPRQLILGKALAATVQSLLVFSAFAPYLVSTFLMGGVDLVSLLAVLAGSLVLSVVLSLFAVCVASFARSRLARGILAIVVIGILLWCSGMGFASGFAMIEQPEMLRVTGIGASIAALVLPVVLAAGYFIAIGCARLAHEYENRSTPLRVTVGLTTLASLCWIVFSDMPPAGVGSELFYVVPTESWMITILPFLFIMTEAESLGRRVQKDVPASRIKALLALPFLPGGGRGVWLYLATWAATLVVVTVELRVWGGRGSAHNAWLRSAREPLLAVAGLYAYGFVFIGLVSGVASFGIRSLKGRNGVRLAIPILFIVTLLGPVLIGLIFDIESWMQFEHPFNPLMVLYDQSYGSSSGASLGRWLLLAATLLTLWINAPRMWRAVRETLRASAASREAARIRREETHAGQRS